MGKLRVRRGAHRLRGGETDPIVQSRHHGVWDIVLAGGIALFLLLLPFHLVLKWLLPGALGTYWKEGLLGLLVVLWALLRLRRRRSLLTRTALDGAVLLFLALPLLRFVLDRNWWVGAWGLYASVLYLPLFWLVPSVLDARPRWVRALLWLLVGVGAVVAAGGVLEFMLDVPLWRSVERMQLQGYPDVFIYATEIRRVYFTFDSPTTLANTLALLLPLSLVLVLTSQRGLLRLLAGVAAVLMAACIIFTFSRGIWVAALLSLVVMAVLAARQHTRTPGVGRVTPNGAVTAPAQTSNDSVPRRLTWNARSLRLKPGPPLWVIGGAVGVLALVWALVSLARPGRPAPGLQGVIEVPPTGYAAVPVTGVTADLLTLAPALGDVEIQTWTLPDPIAGEPDTRRVLYAHPPEFGILEFIYDVQVPEHGALRFAVTLSPEVWSPDKGDGVTFEVYVADQARPADGQAVFVRSLNPKHIPSDRRWRNFVVDLSPWTGRAVNLSLVTNPGRRADWSFDWAGWAEPQVVSLEPGYFSGGSENAILRHTGSVLDWTQDETNRDRLAAWGLALDAWRRAPLWGTGLGSTGLAALRTQPEGAFVTESQVLKALVELGPLGLLVLAILWFQIARVGLRAYRTTPDPVRRTLLLGVLTSLLVVFVEGWVYQNLEVKQVNAYFWTLVGLLAFMTREGESWARAEDGPSPEPLPPAPVPGDSEM